MSSEPKKNGNRPDFLSSTKVVPPGILWPFILVTSLFALWGFANDFTNPLVRAFREIFLISNFQSSFVQAAFYGGYGTMAIPAALIIRKYSFKTGILIGLGFYAIGACLVIPAALCINFWMFLLALYILTFGLAFLETSANPYILSLGSPETATQRLNFAQSFNPMGSLIGIAIAGWIVMPSLGIYDFRVTEKDLHPEYATMLPGEVDGKIIESLEVFRDTKPEDFQEFQRTDLQKIQIPYVSVGVIVLLVFIAFIFTKMPDTGHAEESIHITEVLRHLSNFKYLGGVVAQTFYVGAQIMMWTFIVHYGVSVMGYTAAGSQQCNLIAMGIFVTSRFICTAMLKYVRPGMLLALLAIAAMVLTLGVIFVPAIELIPNVVGFACLIGVSGCMSLMFPTIYGIALDGQSVDDAKLGSAGLIFAIVGGALMPPLQAMIMDIPGGKVFGIDTVPASFILPFGCFFVIAVYGSMTSGMKARAGMNGASV